MARKFSFENELDSFRHDLVSFLSACTYGGTIPALARAGLSAWATKRPGLARLSDLRRVPCVLRRVGFVRSGFVVGQTPVELNILKHPIRSRAMLVHCIGLSLKHSYF